MRRPTKEHYSILQVSQNASLDEIKKAYRKRAFELHPDLNPNNPNANTDFQLLNEAYVVLIDQDKQENVSKAQANAQYQNHQKQGEQTRGQEGASTNRQEEAYQQARQNNNQTKQEDKQKSKQEEKKSEQKQENPKSEKHRRTYAKNPFHSRKKASAAYSSESNKAQSRVHSKVEQEEQVPSQEEVMRDLLNDDFARRVYEDIYSSLENSNTPTTKKADSKLIQIDWSKLKPNIDLSNGVGGFMKNWLRKQIDDELEYRLPVSNLYPGSKVRLQIGQGFSNETKTVDITLPKDFVIGKPVRLVGLGKKIGKVQGDLYLTLLPSNGIK